MEKKKFVIKVAAWTAAIVAVILLVLGLGWGKVIEESLFGEITKWIAVGVGIIALVEGLMLSTVIPVAWHFRNKTSTPAAFASSKAMPNSGWVAMLGLTSDTPSI